MKFNQEERRLAKERDHFLCHVYIDGAERVNRAGVLSFTGTLAPECCEELWEMVRRWMDEGKI